MITKVKLTSFVMVLAMVFSAFGAFMPLTGADVVNVTDSREIRISATDLDNNPLFPGMQDVNFYVTIMNDWGTNPDDTSDTIYTCEAVISTTVRNEAGLSVTSPVTNWDQREDLWGGSIANGNSHSFSPFIFDLRGDAVPGTYNLTVILNYKNNSAGGSDHTYTGYILFEIEYRANIGNIGGLIPGDREKSVSVLLDANDDTPSNEGMDDLALTIELPDGDFSWYGTTSMFSTATNPGTIEWYEAENFWYTISVSVLKDAGTYTGSYSLTYTTEQDVDCMETGDVEFIVGHLAMLSADVAVDTIAQGTNKVTWALTFTNVGTVDLFSIKLMIDDDSDAFTFVVADHWEDAGTVSYAWIELGDIAVGETATANMEVGIDLYIPEGLHKVMFMFTAKYQDPDTAVFRDTTVDWTMGAYEHVPRIDMGMGSFTLDPESSDVEGCFIWLTVTDTEVDIMLTSVMSLSLADQLVDNGLMLTVQNYGNIDYTNVVLRIETNSAASPFLNVVDPAADYSEDAILGTLGAGSSPMATLRVDLVPGTPAGVHSVPVQIDAVNADMGESIQVTIDARITITGVGPKLEITEVTPDSIKKGADFVLTITITNNGDDTARNVVLTQPNAGVNPLQVLEEPNDINGDLSAPSGAALPMYLDDIAPGESVTVDVPMKANKDMSSGHVYVINFAIDYTDSFGDGPSHSELNHLVSLKSSGFGGSVVGWFYYALILLLIVVSLFIIIYSVIYVKKYKKDQGQKVVARSFVPPEEPQVTDQPPAPPETPME